MAIFKLTLLVWCGLTLPNSGLCNKPPVFTHAESYLTLVEDMAPGSNVTWLSASDDDNQKLTFSILGTSALEYFEIQPIGPMSALIILSSPLDRETLAQITLSFQVSDGVNPPISQQCLIIITDVNDNSPVFANLPNKVDILEDSPNGTLVFTVLASDRDTGVWGMVTYQLLNELTMFEMNPQTGNITLIGKLIYLVKRTYILHVMAVDGGGLNTTADVTINVLDSKSRPPYFITSLPYSANVFENDSVGTAVIQVTAYDGLTGLPGQVVYSIVSGDFGFFAINSSNGWINIQKAINCSNPDVMLRKGLLEIVIKATSISSTTKTEVSSWTLVTIQLIDVNDHRPTFDQESYNTSMGKNSRPFTLLTFDSGIRVSDLDMGDNGKYRLFLEQDGHLFDAFDVLPTNGEGETSLLIYVKNFDVLDLERMNTVSFLIVAQEYKTVERYSSSASVMVSLLDQSDKAPVFSQNEYTSNIHENPKLGQFVVQVTATVQDSRDNNRITYSLLGSKASLFMVNLTTGVVYVNIDAASNHSLLDREKDPTIFLMIEAVSGSGLQSFAQLNIILEDVNDNPPVMTNSLYYATLQENSAVFQFPVTIKATDPDLNGRIIYSIIGVDHLSNFAIDRYTGIASVVAAVDYEALKPGTNGILNFTVVAADEDVPMLNSTATLSVIVQDMNDNIPQFMEHNYQAALLENFTGGYRVTKVTANDSDGTSPNNLVIYSIVSGSRDQFLIDPNSGLITVAFGATLDLDFSSQYIITVRATDCGAPPLNSSVLVNITLRDVNNKPPVFVGGKQFLTTVREDAEVGAYVLHLLASDPDDNAQLRYQFVNSSILGFDANGDVVNDKNYLLGLLAVDASSGLVRVEGVLNGEIVLRLSINVVVVDINAPTSAIQNDTASITVFIKRIDNSPPNFLPSAIPLTVNVPETSPPGSTVARLVAIDPYKVTNPVSYFIVYNSEASRRFEITDANRQSGFVTVKSSLYLSSSEGINLTIMATKSGQSSLNRTTTLVVIVNVESSELRWEVFPSAVSILENSTIGTNVTKVLAVGRSGQDQITMLDQILYFITSDVMGKFSIDNKTGILVTAGVLNARVMAAYHLMIEARAGLNRVIGEMTIRVLGSNNNSPKFEQPFYIAYALTNATVGTWLLTVRAVDDDDDSNSFITYYMDRKSGNGSWHFGVDPINGSIVVSSSLTNSAGDWFFAVIASDRGSPPLVGSTVVHVMVIDSNGNRLRITSPPENVKLYIIQNQPLGQFVVQVKTEYVGTDGGNHVNYYLVQSLASPDWRFFTIDRQTGVITTADFLTPGKLTYNLQVQAKDISNAIYTDYRNLTIAVRTGNEDFPKFDRIQFPSPFKVSVLEGVNNLLIARVSGAEKPSSDSGAICYYIIGGTEEWKRYFFLNKFSGDLWLVVSLFQSLTTDVSLIVKVSDDCWSGYWEMERNLHAVWNASDDTLLLVQVIVLSSDHGQPKFSRQWFIAGILPDVQLKEPVLNLADYTVNPGSGNQSHVFYTLGTEFRSSVGIKGGIDALNRPPFAIGHTDGILKTNSYFQDTWIGSINFDVYVGASSPYLSGASNVTVYLLSNHQRIKVVFRGVPNDVSAIQEEFTEFLSNITGTFVGVNAIHVHLTDAGTFDPEQTDMFLYAVDPSLHSVFDALTLKSIIDESYVHKRDVFNQFNVTEVMPVKDLVSSHQVFSGTERSLIIAFVIVGVFLILLLCLLFIIGCLCQKKYKRKIKAANAIAAESGQSNIGFGALTMPGTNAYNSEGSNPVWHENFGDQFYNLSDTDSRNSYDENTRQTTSGSQEEFIDNSEMNKNNHHSKKMHFYKVNGFHESKPNAYSSDNTLNLATQSRMRRLLPEKTDFAENGLPHTNGIVVSSVDFPPKSTNV